MVQQQQNNINTQQKDTISASAKTISNMKTIRIRPEEFEEIINHTTPDEIRTYPSQIPDSTSAIQDVANFMETIKGYIITKIYIRRNFESETEAHMLYWAPCDFLDILAVTCGLTEPTNYKELDELVSNLYFNDIKAFPILGKDIIKALDSYTNEEKNTYRVPMIDNFIENYVDTEKPIAPNIFYNLRLRRKSETREIIIACNRNLDLSPRPFKK